MTAPGFQFDCLLDMRFAPHAASPYPVWLWSTDGRRILWANPAGAAIFGATTPADLASMTLDDIHPARRQIARLAELLPHGSTGRLERLRGFGARVGGLLTCTCSRIDVTPHGEAIFVVSAERAGPDLSLAENARRLLADNASPVSAYDAAGRLLYAAPENKPGGVDDLATIGAGALIADALKAGAASGITQAGKLSLARIGAGDTTILLATLDAIASADKNEVRQTLPETLTETPTETSTETPPESPPATSPTAQPPQAARNPLRFVWRIDDSGRFAIESDEFIRLIGPATAAAFDRPWTEIASRLTLDPNGALTRALAAHETFSGIVVPWPVDGSAETLPVELSGLPVFDRERAFRGYRGFGICRDIARIEALAMARDLLPAVSIPETAPPVVVPPAAGTETPRPAAENIYPFPAAAPPVPLVAAVAQDNVKEDDAQENAPPTLSPVEKLAFRELARRLGDGLRQAAQAQPSLQAADPRPVETLPDVAPRVTASAVAAMAPAPRPRSEAPILDRLPFGILVYRLNELLYANKAFLDWTGYTTLYELVLAGGLDTLFLDASDNTPAQSGTPLTISTQSGGRMPVDGKLFSSSWNDESALVLMVEVNRPVTPPAPVADDTRLKDAEAARVQAESGARELASILDTATDGVIVLDGEGRILSGNRSAQALFGHDEAALRAHGFGDLFARESRRAALDYLARLGKAGSAVLINEGREVIGRVRQKDSHGGLIPLFMTLGRVGESEGAAPQKFCAVFRDITAWKKTEEELLVARRKAETSSAGKSELLAKISHEMRSPLNAIIGFSEVMIGERFGPIGSERYRDYLKDIHASGEHLITLLNDLNDLSRIETGKLDLTFARLGLNDVTQQCVAILQPQANRGRVIIRTAFAENLPQVVADAGAVRQIVLNLIASSLKMTGAGGQVIVSTAMTDDGDVALRVRDSGTGMSQQELAQALDPFRDLATTPRWGASGTGLGLPITKALAEANHAHFRITSAAETGTLIEIAFPATRMLAE